MCDRTLIITAPRNSGYRDLCLDDSRKRGENPLPLKTGDRHALRNAQRWVDVADHLVVYSDFDLSDDVWEIVRDAEITGVNVEIRTLGSKPRPSIKERLQELVS